MLDAVFLYDTTTLHPPVRGIEYHLGSTPSRRKSELILTKIHSIGAIYWFYLWRVFC